MPEAHLQFVNKYVHQLEMMNSLTVDHDGATVEDYGVDHVSTRKLGGLAIYEY